MAADQLTIDKYIDISKNNPPEFGYIYLPLSRYGSVTTSARVLGFVAQKPYEIRGMHVFPTTIASGTLKVDLLINGVSVCSTTAQSTTADTATTVAVFSATRIEQDDLVIAATTSDSSTVTDVLGMLVLRPLFGMVERA